MVDVVDCAPAAGVSDGDAAVVFTQTDHDVTSQATVTAANAR
jgi:hypothetical protein